MPKKLLSVGMGGMLFAQIGEQIFRLLAGDLQPEGIGAQIKLARPCQDSALLADGCTAKERVVAPRRKNTFTYMCGKIHFSFGTVFETQPDAIAVEDFHSYDLYHGMNNTTFPRCGGANPGSGLENSNSGLVQAED
jgi:hypothetical protein